MNNYRFIIAWGMIIFSCFVLQGCNNQKKEAENIIRKSGKNAVELRKVLDHYSVSGEKEKYKAACFLIANMRDKNTRICNKLEPYLKEAYNALHYYSGHSRKYLDAVIKRKTDSLIQRNGMPSPDSFSKILDIYSVKADFLIDNIDLAFKAWRQPWARHVKFKDFCEYILPYRIHDEPLSDWRQFFFDKYISFADSVKDRSDPKQIVEAISNHLYERWTHLDHFNTFNCYPSAIGMERIGGGTCDHRYFLITAILRSIGVPVAIEGTLQWTNYTGGHSWNVLLGVNGKMRPFNGGEDNFRFYEKCLIPMGDGGSICTKVYREMFSKQRASLPEQGEKHPANPFFNNPCLLDVTDNYDFPKTKLVLNVENKKMENRTVYLTVFNYGWNINTIAWAKVRNGKADFGYVGLPAFYIPVYYDFGKPVMIDKPMVMYKEKEKRQVYDPDLTVKKTVRLYRKFSFSGDFLFFADGLVGCKIQASNTPDFKNAVDLHFIEKKAKGYEQETFQNDKSYQYIRLLSADSSNIRLSELEFWGVNKVTGDSEKLTGKIIGSSAVVNTENDAVFINAFDGDISTNFNAGMNSWIGLDLREKSNNFIFNKIWFLPRNNLNVIEKGHVYELFYLGNRWVSLGRKVAGKYAIEYNNVPVNALLLLKDHTAGRQERIFMYDFEKKEQIWW